MVTVRIVDARQEVASTLERLLIDADDSFVPPLTGSDRSGISRSGEEGGATDIDGYVQRCLERPMVGAFDGDDLVGFASFHRFTDTGSLEGYTPTNHVEILIVDDEYRNQGLATSLYRFLLDDLPPALAQPFVSTKTWSTNHAHIAILERLSFSCVERLPDDREPGVDTVYYARTV